jgi:protein SCO1/2
MIRTLTTTLAGAALLASGCGGSSTPTTTTAAASFRGTVISPPAAAADFALRDQAGKLVRLSDLRGRYVIVTFLYTHCPDVCPLIADHLNDVLLRLGPQRSRLRVLAVSVDPRRDTTVAARDFVRAHRLLPQFRYLIGTRKQLAPVWRAYHVGVLIQGSTVSHSAYQMLIDPRGRLRLLYDANAKAADVHHDLRLLQPALG